LSTKQASTKFTLLVIASISLSMLFGWVDTFPTWNDTGITAFTVLITSLVFGLMMPRYAWLWAIIISAGICLFNIYWYNNFESLMVLPFAFSGSYGGVFIRRIIFVKNS